MTTHSEILNFPQRPDKSTSYRILMVDDELPVLLTIKRRLRMHFDIVSVLSPTEALQRIATDKPFDIVISDMRMPEMSGVEFLSRVRKIDPSIARIMLTGDLDRETLLQAVNKAEVSKFLEKPVSSDQLCEAIMETAAERDVRNTINSTSSHLLANIEEEFQTPLKHIIGFANIISTSNLPAKDIKEYAGYIIENGNEILAASQSLAILSKIESGDYLSQVSQFDLHDIILENTNPLRRKAKSRDLKFDIDMEASNTVVKADMHIFSLLISTLMSYAIKHAQPSSKISIKTWLVNADSIVLEINNHSSAGTKKMPPVSQTPLTLVDISASKKLNGLELGLRLLKASSPYLKKEPLIKYQENSGFSVKLLIPIQISYSQAHNVGS